MKKEEKIIGTQLSFEEGHICPSCGHTLPHAERVRNKIKFNELRQDWREPEFHEAGCTQAKKQDQKLQEFAARVQKALNVDGRTEQSIARSLEIHEDSFRHLRKGRWPDLTAFYRLRAWVNKQVSR